MALCRLHGYGGYRGLPRSSQSRSATEFRGGLSGGVAFMNTRDRRQMLKATAGFVLAALQPGEELIDFADMAAFRTEYREADPRIRFFDLRHLRSAITPEDEFFTFHQTTTV